MEKEGRIILVTGATGHQGGAVARRLAEDGWTVRALVRDAEKQSARRLAEIGASLAEGDLTDRRSLERALGGAYGVFAVITPFEKGVSAEVEMGMNLADAAKEAGVKHFVYSSVAAANRNTGIPHFDSKWEIEKYINSIGLPETVLRPVFFYYNFEHQRQSILDGTLSLPISPDKQLQMLSPEDFAVFVSKAFDEPGRFIGKAMEIAGEQMTMTGAAEVFGRVIEREVSYVETPADVIRKQSEDMYLMFRWINANDFGADIAALKSFHPAMLSLEDWLRKTGWEDAGVMAA